MNTPKTVSGYCQLVEKISNVDVTKLRGYSTLDKSQKAQIGALRAVMENELSEFYNELLNTKPANR